MSCKTISFDSSTTSTGYTVFIDGVFSYCNVIDKKKIKKSEDRVNEMISSIYKVIEKEKPDICVWETPAGVKNPETQRNLNMIIGAILGKCLEQNIFHTSFRPSEWRKLINVTNEKLPRKREELKQWGINKVKELFDLDIDIDDVSDSILIGQAYINKFSR